MSQPSWRAILMLTRHARDRKPLRRKCDRIGTPTGTIRGSRVQYSLVAGDMQSGLVGGRRGMLNQVAEESELLPTIPWVSLSECYMLGQVLLLRHAGSIGEPMTLIRAPEPKASTASRTL